MKNDVERKFASSGIFAFDERTANQTVKSTKILLSIFLIVQAVMIGAIYKAQALISAKKSVEFGPLDFLMSEDFLAFAFVAILSLVFIFTRSIWFTFILAGLFFLNFASALFQKTKDGFQMSDLSGMSLLMVCIAVMLSMCAYSLHVLKKGSAA